jgi:hypothetical protein
MSYDVAVWEGERPKDDGQALEVFEGLWKRCGNAGDPPSPRVLEFVEALTARYPDLTVDLLEEELDELPWASWPLTGHVMGPFLYINLRWSKAAEVLPFIAETARQHELVCFDPQERALLT